MNKGVWVLTYQRGSADPWVGPDGAFTYGVFSTRQAAKDFIKDHYPEHDPWQVHGHFLEAKADLVKLELRYFKVDALLED